MKVIVTGAGGFIGGHLAARLHDEGHEVYAFDRRPILDWHVPPRMRVVHSMDLRMPWGLVPPADRIYHLAANMGGIGFIEENKLACAMSTEIDVRAVNWAIRNRPERFFFSSSACVYAAGFQHDEDSTALKEWMAWPADPEPGYGLQKLYTEELLKYLHDDEGVETRVARYHNVYGPNGTWDGGREKAPAALCRKIAKAKIASKDYIEIWGDGEQTRSFMYIDDCVEGTLRITDSDVTEPLNLGSSELVSINALAYMISQIAEHEVELKHVPGAQGVRGRNSDNTLIKEKLDWAPSIRLEDGLTKTYEWIEHQVRHGLKGH